MAADLGPLLLCGLAFSFGFQMLLDHFGAPVRRPSFLLTLVAAVLGYLTVNPPTNPGPIAVDGLLAFVIVTAVAREEALRGRMRITRCGLLLDRLRIHYTVAGRDLSETVRLWEPVTLTCPQS